MVKQLSFLPQDYKLPASGSNYMKFEDGVNKFRVLSEPITGWEYWVDDGDKRKPIRTRQFSDISVERRSPTDDQKAPKHFWMLLVWNYGSEQAQILEITQKSIQEALVALSEDPDWGDPHDYDVTVTRSGKELTTSYQINPKPKTPFVTTGKSIPQVDLSAVFEGKDPFDIDPITGFNQA